jgi:hypothetical protein
MGHENHIKGGQNMSNKLKLVKINIKNVLGIKEMEINPNGNVVEISGRNGLGKTSIMESIKDALGVSEYSQLLRNGETKGSVVLDLGAMKITKNYKPSGDTTKLQEVSGITGAMSDIGRPAGVIKSLVNPNSVDPVRLLTAKPKELLDVVLGAIPLTVTTERMASIFGSQVSYDSNEHALVVLSKQTGIVMEGRKLVNRDAKTFGITADQLRATLPDDIPVTEELQDQINNNLDKIEGIRGASRKAGRIARGEFSEGLAKLGSEFEELSDYIEKQNDLLNTAKQELSAKSAEHQAMLNAQTAANEKAIEDELDKADEYQNHNVELSNEIASLKVYENTQSQVKDYESKIATVTKQSDVMTKQLKAIEDYKSELCQDLPIKGLTIEGGKLSMNGIPFQTLNTAARVDLVLELAKLSAGTLGFVMLDNSEMLDKDTYTEFMAKASETDLTFIVARVEDHDLEIK